MESLNNLLLWNKVEKTNPAYTKKAKVGGHSITAIAPQYQILNATQQFGAYGEKWGFKNIELDYSITNIPVKLSIVDYNSKQESIIDTILGLVGFKATFFFPNENLKLQTQSKYLPIINILK